ncbi:ATP-binding cassette domain-containing protein [Helicobacter pylori]|nr:ATP-binding cassette domain-containing protein [Helicobacter pylori]
MCIRGRADLIQPTSGSIRIGGKTPEEARKARAYGYVFQAPTLMEWRTVLQNVMLPLEVMGVPKAEHRPRAERMLALVGLEKFARHYPWQLSGGMQQRVSIARALAFDPQLLFMDEPFGAVDPPTRERLQDEFLKLQASLKKTVLFVTHDLEEAVKLADRICLMNHGKVEQYDDPDALLRDPKTPFVRELILSLKHISEPTSRTTNSNSCLTL